MVLFPLVVRLSGVETLKYALFWRLKIRVLLGLLLLDTTLSLNLIGISFGLTVHKRVAIKLLQRFVVFLRGYLQLELLQAILISIFVLFFIQLLGFASLHEFKGNIIIFLNCLVNGVGGIVREGPERIEVELVPILLLHKSKCSSPTSFLLFQLDFLALSSDYFIDFLFCF